MKAWLSIDFEDIAHDFKREFGIPQDGSLREDALRRAYAAIETFCRTDLDGARLTFFTTGILAEKCPDIVARIAADGHEIACHYFWHDPCRLDPPELFESNLRRAIDALEAASGRKVLGFRAPRFSLKPGDRAHFAALERHLAYDSSLTVADGAEARGLRAATGVTRLALLPVLRRRPAPGLPALRTGGAALKYAPARAHRALPARRGRSRPRAAALSASLRVRGRPIVPVPRLRNGRPRAAPEALPLGPPSPLPRPRKRRPARQTSPHRRRGGDRRPHARPGRGVRGSVCCRLAVQLPPLDPAAKPRDQCVKFHLSGGDSHHQIVYGLVIWNV